jgi:hypothetical protein
LRVRFGPLEYRSPSTGYGSVGDVAVWGYGANLIPYLSVRPYRGEFKAYGDGGFAGDGRSENTISVDGVGQSRYGRAYRPESPVANPWVTTPVFDYLQGAYTFDPARLENVSITHSRSILFVRPDYFLVIDRLTPGDRGVHKYRMKYQLHHAAGQPEVRGVRATAVIGRAGIVVEPLGSDLGLEVVTGRKEPHYEGWHLTGRAGGKPAPALIYTWQASGPSGVETLLYPFLTEGPPTRASVRAARTTDGSVVLTIAGHRPHVTDHVLVGGAGPVTQGHGFELRGALGFVRLVRGEVASLGMAEAESLAGPDLALVLRDASRPRQGLSGWAWTRRGPDGAWESAAGCAGTLVLPGGERRPL